MTTHTLHIDRWHPVHLNELMGCHWRKVHRLKQTDKESIGWALRETPIPLAKVRRRVDLVITLGPRMRGRDEDGYWKSIVDALVFHGLLVDDRKEWFKQGDLTYQRGATIATTVLLTDLE